MKRVLTAICALVALGILISSCSKHPGFKESENGLFYKIIKKADSEKKSQEGDIITISMIYKTEKDSVLFNSNTVGQPVMVRNVKPTYKGDINEIFQILSVGDSAQLIISADSFYMRNANQKTLPPFVTKGSMLHFEIKILSIKTKAEFDKEVMAKMNEQIKAEEVLIKAYIDNNKIKQEPDAEGLYFISLKKGNGKKPKDGNTVAANYVGYLLDGKVFDTNIEDSAKKYNLYDKRGQYKPLEFKLGAHSVIPGWEKGVAMMSVGEKAKLIIPSKLAYADRDMGVIKPFSPLVFFVELKEVKE